MEISSVPSSDPYQYSNYNLMSSTNPMSVASSQNGGNGNQSIKDAIDTIYPDATNQIVS